MRYLVLLILAATYLASGALAAAPDDPAAIVRASLLAVGGDGGVLDQPASFRSTFAVEAYNAEDGQVNGTVTEVLAAFPDGPRYRSDHVLHRPAQGPQPHLVQYFRQGNTLWRVSEEVPGEGRQAVKIPTNDERPRTIPDVLRFLAFVLDRPERFRVAFRDLSAPDGEPDGRRTIGIEVDHGAGSLTYNYQVSADGLPIRVETTTTGFVTEFNDWRRYDGYLLPSEVVMTGGPAAGLAVAAGGTQITTRLTAIDFSPALAADFFELPDDAKAEE